MEIIKRVINNIRHRLNYRLIFISILGVIIIESCVCLILFLTTKKISVEMVANQTYKAEKQLNEKLSEKLEYSLEQFNMLEINREFREITQNYKNRNDVNDFITLSDLFGEVRRSGGKIIDSIAYLREDGKVFCETPLNTPSQQDYKNTEWYRRCRENNGYIVWSEPYSPVYFKYNQKTVLGMMKELSNNSDGEAGILILTLKRDYIENELSSLELGEGAELFIVDSENKLLTSVRDEKLCEKAISNTQYTEGFGYFSNNPTYMMFSTVIPVNGWRVIAVVPEKVLFSRSAVVMISILLVLISGVIVLVFVLFYTMKNITDPIREIEVVIDSIENQEITSRISGDILERKDEIGALANQFNTMLDSIEELIKRIAAEEKVWAKAEMSALQQQINSHFLYNTLESISLKIMNGNKEQSFDMVRRLAQYFRLALNRGNDITTVRNEIQHIENYVAIERYRYKKTILCTVDVEPELLEVKMPKLLLQPLVENSIIHGFFDMDTQGEITVTGKRQGDYMIFLVSDNGVGFPNEDMNHKIKESDLDEKETSYALKNIYIRIQLFYKDKGDIFFYNNDRGACVELVLPLEGGF